MLRLSVLYTAISNPVFMLEIFSRTLMIQQPNKLINCGEKAQLQTYFVKNRTTSVKHINAMKDLT